MKFRIFIIAGFIFALSACKKDFFDQVPDDRLTDDEVFSRRAESEQFLANVYNYIKDESDQTMDNRAPWLGISDEGDVTYAGQPTYQMNLGNWSWGRDSYNYWTHYYRGIRAATYFMQRIGENQEILASEGGAQEVVRLKAEARALRAWFYADILKQYGPVIIIPGDEVVEPSVPYSEISYPRSTYDESVDFIVNELDKAAEDLPLWYSGPLQYGRMTKAVCMAIKSRVLLYAASPLWNGNTDYSDFKNLDGTPLVNTQYDQSKWKRAADAAKDVIDLELFDLYKEYDGNGQIDPFLSYQNVLLNEWNEEVIFSRKDNELAAPSGRSWEWRCAPRYAGGTSGNAATQQQVDAYQMANGEQPILGYEANGVPIINSQSGYTEVGFSSENAKYTEAGTHNMYVGREPRFYVSIGYNGSYWVNKTAYPEKIGLYFSGNTGKNGAGNNFSRTGYLIKKNNHPQSNLRTSQTVKRPLVLFRLAEIYLNYAEALNEYNPGHPDILKYVNLIRERGGIPPLNTNEVNLRERIRTERRIELAFERHRYFDTRRWKIAMETDGGPFYGMDIDKGSSLTDPAFYKRVKFEDRVFDHQHYLFPIPTGDVDKNVKLVQNPGW